MAQGASRLPTLQGLQFDTHVLLLTCEESLGKDTEPWAVPHRTSQCIPHCQCVAWINGKFLSGRASGIKSLCQVKYTNQSGSEMEMDSPLWQSFFPSLHVFMFVIHYIQFKYRLSQSRHRENANRQQDMWSCGFIGKNDKPSIRLVGTF